MRTKRGKTNILRGFAALLAAVLLCLVLPLSVQAQDASDTNALASQIADELIAARLRADGAADLQSWADEVLPQMIGAGGEWYAIALCQRAADVDLSAYRDALQRFLRDADNLPPGAVERQRYALVLQLLGGGDYYLSTVAAETVGAQGVMSYVWGLHLADNGLATPISAEEMVTWLLNAQGSDGGWSLRGGASASDVDVTAMVLQALASRKHRTEIADAIDRALALLSARQCAGGDFQSYGVNCPESGAQVIVALCSLGIDCEDARFIKNGNTLFDGILLYRTAEGVFSHTAGGEENVMATVQCLYAMVAVERAAQGRETLYAAQGVSGVVDLTDPAQPLPDDTAPTLLSRLGVKGGICLGAVVLSLVGCAVLWLCGKRGAKHYLSIALVCAMVLGAALLIDVTPADQYYTDAPPKQDAVGEVTLTIRFDTVAGKKETAYLGTDGVLLPVTTFAIDADDTVFDILTEAAAQYGLRVQNTGATAASNALVYIRGINDLREFDHGDLSGWVYLVNGERPSVGCGEYRLSDGDVIEFHYTCALGDDIR